MIRIIAITKELKIMEDVSIQQLESHDFLWYWVDFISPTKEESGLLESFFHFHPLAIEDCLQYIQRPKLDHYDGYHFFVLHSLNQQTYKAEEVDLFISKDFLVSFHQTPVKEVENVYSEIRTSPHVWEQGTSYVMYRIMDKLVDHYFPIIYQLEDRVNELDNSTQQIRLLLDELFHLRGTLLRVRHTIIPMGDLLYRILNSKHLEIVHDQLLYFADIYDHLLKLSEMIESNREITADIRDSYLSLNSNRMNTIMMTLTVITTIFMPLTFIAGIYGMNFKYMPELSWRYGYFYVLGFMAILGFTMFYWFKKKGWFED
ncbi:magnesium/cobalt transporter CorA [Tepidibacillus fermentans]|uniref:Magnesium transport protein CorA n=1 Tax=Tepidibacillus fermentans TaxID=1281767 RepID=A0A4R3KKL7_9BACI|nr:magnesium/cobalt transporter CorA [Tepidibacillus fermentans]TCS84431.1 magnesium transporter [Tepidibacillus fermentans]